MCFKHNVQPAGKAQSPEQACVWSGLPGEGTPSSWAWAAGAWVQLGKAWPTAPGCFPLTPPLCQNSSRPSSLGSGSFHMPGPAQMPPWSTPRLSHRTPSQRNAVTRVSCSCWEQGGPPALAPLPKNPKPLAFCCPRVPLTLQIPKDLCETRHSHPPPSHPDTKLSHLHCT